MDDPLELFTTLTEEYRFKGEPERSTETDRRGREAHCRLFFAEFTADFCFILQGAAPGLRNYLTVRICQPERGEAAVPPARLHGWRTRGGSRPTMSISSCCRHLLACRGNALMPFGVCTSRA